MNSNVAAKTVPHKVYWKSSGYRVFLALQLQNHISNIERLRKISEVLERSMKCSKFQQCV